MREKRLFYSNFAITQQTAKKLSQRPIADFILHSKSAHMHTNAPNVGYLEGEGTEIMLINLGNFILLFRNSTAETLSSTL